MNVSSRGPVFLDYCLLAFLALLWGSSFLLIKIAVETIPPLTLIAFRVTLAAAILLIVLKIKGGSLPNAATDWTKLGIQALFSAILSWPLLAWGQQYIDSGLAGVLNSTTPIWVFAITFFLTRHEALDRLKLGGVMLGTLGIILIFGPSVLSGLGSQIAGQGAAIACAILYAFAAIYGRNLRHLPPLVTAAGTLSIASLVLVPLALIADKPWTLKPELASVVAAALLSVLCTAVAMMIYFRLINNLGSLATSSQSYLRSIVAVLLGVFVAGELLSPLVIVGVSLALTGVILINKPFK